MRKFSHFQLLSHNMDRWTEGFLDDRGVENGQKCSVKIEIENREC